MVRMDAHEWEQDSASILRSHYFLYQQRSLLIFKFIFKQLYSLPQLTVLSHCPIMTFRYTTDGGTRETLEKGTIRGDAVFSGKFIIRLCLVF